MMFRRGAFTLIELMVALLLMALLTGAVTLSFAAPLRKQRREDALAAIRQFDADARTQAIARGQNVRLVIDPTSNTLSRLDGASLSTLRARLQLPSSMSITESKIGDNSLGNNTVNIDISSNGWSRSYALCAGNQWIAFAGLSGQMSLEDHAPTFAPSSKP